MYHPISSAARQSTYLKTGLPPRRLYAITQFIMGIQIGHFAANHTRLLTSFMIYMWFAFRHPHAISSRRLSAVRTYPCISRSRRLTIMTVMMIVVRQSHSRKMCAAAIVNTFLEQGRVNSKQFVRHSSSSRQRAHTKTPLDRQHIFHSSAHVRNSHTEMLLWVKTKTVASYHTNAPCRHRSLGTIHIACYRGYFSHFYSRLSASTCAWNGEAN